MSTSVTLGPPPAGTGVGSDPGLSKIGVPEARTSASPRAPVQQEFGGAAVVVELSGITLNRKTNIFGILADSARSATSIDELPVVPPRQIAPSAAAPPDNPVGARSQEIRTSPRSSTRENLQEHVRQEATSSKERGTNTEKRAVHSELSQRSADARRRASSQVPRSPAVASPRERSGMFPSAPDRDSRFAPYRSPIKNLTAAQRGHVVEPPRFQGLQRAPDGGPIAAGRHPDERVSAARRLMRMDGVPLGGMAGRDGVPLDAGFIRSRIASLQAPAFKHAYEAPPLMPPAARGFGGLNESQSSPVPLGSVGLTPREDAIVRSLSRGDQVVRAQDGTPAEASGAASTVQRFILVQGPDGQQHAAGVEELIQALAQPLRGEVGSEKELREVQKPLSSVSEESVARADRAMERQEADARDETSPVRGRKLPTPKEAERAEGQARSERNEIAENRVAEVRATLLSDREDQVSEKTHISRAEHAHSAAGRSGRGWDLSASHGSAAHTIAVGDLQSQGTSSILERLRSVDPGFVAGASVPTERDVQRIAGMESRAHHAFAQAENAYAGRADFIVIA